MASSEEASSSERPDASTPGDDSNNDHDPFTSTASTAAAPAQHQHQQHQQHQQHLRFSSFDQELFAAVPGSSPRQAKRALEAHLAETDRRLDEAGKLGTALVSQRRTLAEQLHEIDKLQAEAELNPELRQKLADIERDYNDLARESARVFLPKQRPPTNETTIQTTPFTIEGRSGRRSVSPSKFESQATASGSPTKLSVPNRKSRNQASSRVHDIEFAAEISTSLIAQVRNLQSVLAERDDQVKDLRNDMARMEQDSEAFQQRLKILDESEHRYKEENWDLQTRLQEVASQQRDAADREKKLNQALSAANAAKATAQKELDEVKLSHAKLTEEHAAATKHYDIELSITRRSLDNGESERAQLQRKIDDLTAQNQEFAKAMSAQRYRSQEREAELASRQETYELLEEHVTPEESPPASPVKMTPRHSGLEAETIKTSLQHAQRTIQGQRSQLHREKTEKLELKRIIQDLRDDLEKARGEIPNGGSGAPPSRRGRKAEPKEPVKKPPRLLGNFRSSRQEIISDDPEWEDTHDLVPRAASFSSEQPPPIHGLPGPPGPPGPPRSSGPSNSRQVLSPLESADGDGDDFETANEASDGGFDTSHEDADATGMGGADDAFSDSDGALTETEETPTRGINLGRAAAPAPAPRLPRGYRRHGHSGSFDSMVSASTDDDVLPPQLRTPSASAFHRKFRRLSKGTVSNPRQTSAEFFASSPAASFVSNNQSVAATPQAGQSLFAELQDFGSDDDSVHSTPGRQSLLSMTPASPRGVLSRPAPLPPMSRLLMVDSGMMTDPIEFADDGRNGRDGRDGSRPSSPRAPYLNVADAARRPRSVESVLQDFDFHASPTTSEDRDQDEREEGSSSRTASIISYRDADAQYEVFDEKLGKFVPRGNPALGVPTAEAEAEVKDTHPPQDAKESPSFTLRPSLSMTPIVVQQDVEPAREPEPELMPKPEPLSLSMSPIAAESLEPVTEPEPAPAPLTMSDIVSEGSEPVEEPVPAPPALTLSTILVEDLEPEEEPISPLPSLTLSTILSEGLEPISRPATPSPALCLSPIFAEHWEPKAEAPAPPPSLTMMPIRSEMVEPVAASPSPPMTATRDVAPIISVGAMLGLSSVMAEEIKPVSEPVSEPEPEAFKLSPSLGLSPVRSEDLAPEDAPPGSEAKSAFGFSSLAMEHTSPIEEKSPATPTFVLSPISGEAVEPVSPPALESPQFAFSTIECVETRPITPRSPKRDGFIIPRDMSLPFANVPPSGQSMAQSLDDVFAKFSKDMEGKDIDTVIAVDEGPFSSSSDTDLSRTNVDSSFARTTSDHAAQTSLTASTIEWLMGEGGGSSRNGHKGLAPGYNKGKSIEVAHENGMPRRPSTAISVRSFDDAPALLPSQHQMVPAVRATSSGGTQAPGAMGPPLFPASAMKGHGRPHTPSANANYPSMSSASGRATPTYRSTRAASSQSNAEFHLSPVKPPAVSRQSSSSSFVSEIDMRFNMRPQDLGVVDPSGFSSNTDPRMIQAITQTMIGEFLWKYTRKAGRGELSERRHRRYFWVHPYTRTIYWSERDPTTAGRTELRAKSLPIEAVRVVTDDNVMPPGLYRKSLVIISPGRTIKFTCATGQRHETWFNALSYLLLRTTNNPHQSQSDTEDIVDSITRDITRDIAREDADEFNPSMARQGWNSNSNRLMAPSISSRTSRMTRNESGGGDKISLEIPTLNSSNKQQQAVGHGKVGMGSLGSKLGGYLRAGAPKPRSRTSFQSARNETSEAHDSAEDLREMIERQDREADRLENVRMCCDGKHDVGTLPHIKRRSANIHLHNHPAPSPIAIAGSASAYGSPTEQSTVTTPTTSSRPKVSTSTS